MDPAALQDVTDPAAAQPSPQQPPQYDGLNGNPLYDLSHGGHYGTLPCRSRHPLVQTR